MNFGKRLRQLRKEKGLTQAELAKLLSIGESTVSFYESGKRQPDYETLIRLAEVFNVSVDYLLGRTEHKAPNTNKPGSSEVIAAHRADDPMNDLPEEAQRSKEYILKKYGKK